MLDIKRSIKHSIKCAASSLLAAQISDMAVDTEHVSFDIFDTLILRRCADAYDIFRLMKSGVEDYATLRIRAELKARSVSTDVKARAVRTDVRARAVSTDVKARAVSTDMNVRAAGAAEEVSLDDIYRQVARKTGRRLAEALKAEEIRTELEYCFPNAETVHFFHRLRDMGKRIYLISDMYLPEYVICQMLDRCDISGWQKLYISSEYKRTKRSGRLFDCVLDENRIRPSELTHIGDNLISDYLIPVKKGIRAYLYKKGK